MAAPRGGRRGLANPCWLWQGLARRNGSMPAWPPVCLSDHHLIKPGPRSPDKVRPGLLLLARRAGLLAGNVLGGGLLLGLPSAQVARTIRRLAAYLRRLMAHDGGQPPEELPIDDAFGRWDRPLHAPPVDGPRRPAPALRQFPFRQLAIPAGTRFHR